MDVSIEMKLQAINKMLDMRNQLIAMQENLGMYDGFDASSSVLVYEIEDLLKLSEAVHCELHETGYITDQGNVSVAFEYKGSSFSSYFSPDDYERYKDKIARGSKDD